MAISDRIKYYRKQSNLTQSQLAELIGVSPQAISKWETGIGSPDLSMIVPLAIALRISTDELADMNNVIVLGEAAVPGQRVPQAVHPAFEAAYNLI